MKKKLLILALHLAVVCAGLLCAVQFAEEMVSLKQTVYYYFNPISEAGDTDHLYTLRPAQVNPGAWYEDRPLIHHAGGQIDGNTYTNSLEAVENTLSRGEAFIELDFRYTGDGHLVCAHAWYDVYPENYMPTLEEFLATRIQGKYTPLTAGDVISLMAANPQMHLVTDMKEEGSLIPVITELTELAQGDPEILDRFVIQLYTGREKEELQAVYPFHDSQFLFTTYQWGQWQHEVAAICNEENISVITVPYGEMSDEDAALMASLGFTVYEFTVNRADYAALSQTRGISGFYTDCLYPADLEGTRK